ncbi:MAG: branched-chain amino acid ABC transporter permease [Candidatus Eiseniibacteriota bacterium]
MSGYLAGVLVILAINVVAAYGAFLPMAAGQLNLGVAGFMSIGAYTSAYVSNSFGLPALLTVFIGAGFTGLVALVVAIPVLRTRGIYLALATFAVGQIVQSTILNLEFVGGAAGYPVTAYLGFPTIAGFAAGTTAVVYLLFRTRFGLNVTAVHDDEVVADLFGVNARVHQTAAFALGAAIAGLAGALYAHQFSVIEAQHFNVLMSIYIVLYVLLGGTQTVFGPLIGAAVFTLLPEALRASAEWRYAIFAVLIIRLLGVRPQGLLTGATLRRLLGTRALGAEAGR